MNIHKYEFTHNGQQVYQIQLCTIEGLSIDFWSLGASIGKIALKHSSEKEQLLNLSFSEPSAYANCLEYAGMTIGPNAGRITDTTLHINGSYLHLTHNEGSNSLHGGTQNISHHNWHINELIDNGESAVLTMETFQTDGIDGWPGNRHYQVTYTLTEGNCLSIDYLATTDRDTYVNLTNHTYWNLTGDPDAALAQTLQLSASKVCVNAADHLPLYSKDVTDSIFDLRSKKKLRDVISLSEPISSIDLEQLQFSRGFNHGYLFDASLPHMALLHCPDTNVTLELITDAPGIVVYSGGFIESGNKMANKKLSCSSCGIALEAQELPTISSYQITTPEKPFHRNIQFHLYF